MTYFYDKQFMPARRGLMSEVSKQIHNLLNVPFCTLKRQMQCKTINCGMFEKTENGFEGDLDKRNNLI